VHVFQFFRKTWKPNRSGKRRGESKNLGVNSCAVLLGNLCISSNYWRDFLLQNCRYKRSLWKGFSFICCIFMRKYFLETSPGNSFHLGSGNSESGAASWYPCELTDHKMVRLLIVRLPVSRLIIRVYPFCNIYVFCMHQWRSICTVYVIVLVDCFRLGDPWLSAHWLRCDSGIFRWNTD